jgi:hypothetical protein
MGRLDTLRIKHQTRPQCPVLEQIEEGSTGTVGWNGGNRDQSSQEERVGYVGNITRRGSDTRGDALGGVDDRLNNCKVNFSAAVEGTVIPLIDYSQYDCFNRCSASLPGGFTYTLFAIS